jgi:hypothetical protein
MIKDIQIQVLPEHIDDQEYLENKVLKKIGLQRTDDYHLEWKRRSIDARQRIVKYNIGVKVYIDEKPEDSPIFEWKPFIKHSEPVYIIGAGPAGLFAALECLNNGLKPIVIERGKNVRDRRRDLAQINKEHIVNPESNYCFGEGGAGTYSDGKLYTRSGKRGSINKILATLVHFGADSDILVNAHPHIGTNKLPKIIVNIREAIIQAGGEIHFDERLIDLTISDNQIEGIETSKRSYDTSNVILATGHSARDIFELLDKRNVEIELKPFALGVRIEHQQELIDQIQYHCDTRSEKLPPASYSLVQQVDGRGVYSFCMCPGGIIAPCATNPGEVVTNGWSPSKRNNPYSNSGIVVELKAEDFEQYKDKAALAGMYFQANIEQNAWKLAGGTQKVPAQRMLDFVHKKDSLELPKTSYQPGIEPVPMDHVFPEFISHSLRNAFTEFGKKMKGYLTNDAILHAPESRTSSPVRIPRDKKTLNHVTISNLYPCAEGAGYAGGIVSAAIDGNRCVEQIIAKLND